MKKFIKYSFALLLTIIYNQYLHFFISIYIFTIIPDVKYLPSRHDLSKIYISNDESFIYLPVGKSNSSRPYEFSSNFLIISDPHILGPNINFIDKFWHELNMQISFNAILAALSGQWKNEYEKIILGDILDFGLFYRSTDQNNQVFQKDLNIFYKIFKNSHAVLGNHDVAFPLMTNPHTSC